MADKLSELVPIISDVFTLDDPENGDPSRVLATTCRVCRYAKAMKFVARDLAKIAEQAARKRYATLALVSPSVDSWRRNGIQAVERWFVVVPLAEWHQIITIASSNNQ